MMKKQRLLVVDDDLFICKYIEDVAIAEGFEVRTAASPEEFDVIFVEFEPGVVLLDLLLPRTDGVELLREIAERDGDVSVLLMSGMDVRNLEAAERVGVERGLKMCGALEKPFTPKALRESLRRVLETQLDESELRRALERDELVPFYQPKIDLLTGRVVGAEVLARWRHPEHGLLPPRLFIPLAEHRGMIGDLTEVVSRQAISQLRQWRDVGHDLHLAINISARDLRRWDYPDRWSDLLARYEIPSSAVMLEITESEAMWTTVSTTEVLTRIRLQGLQLAIDDFGTGFSSLVLLQKLPFSEIKIDRSFVIEARTSRDAYVITRSIVELGHALGLRVTAEGIENEETYDLLRDLGCDMAQGYHIARPMAGEDFSIWLARADSVTTTA